MAAIEGFHVTYCETRSVARFTNGGLLVTTPGIMEYFPGIDCPQMDELSQELEMERENVARLHAALVEARKPRLPKKVVHHCTLNVRVDSDHVTPPSSPGDPKDEVYSDCVFNTHYATTPLAAETDDVDEAMEE